MTQTPTYGMVTDVGGVQSTVPVRFAVACDEDARPIPGAEVREVTITASGSDYVGQVDAWPGLQGSFIGLAETAEGPILLALAVTAGLRPGDTVRIGPLVELAPADR